MFHEILFVLSGYPGNVFTAVTPPNSHHVTTFAITEDFPLLHPTEREALNRLGHLGWMYRQLDLFITETLQSTTTTTTATKGIYQQALATGLSQILGDYRSLLLSLEKRWVTKQDHVVTLPNGGGMVPLSFLTSTMGRWELIIPSLLRLTKKIQQQHQARILDLVMDQVNTGIPELHSVIMYLVQQLSNVFFRQVTAWMMYGQLPSQPCLDFFITPKQQLDDNNTDQGDHTEWQRHYTIHWDRVPGQLLSNEVAASVFYVGKVVATLQSKTTMTTTRIDRLCKNRERLVMPAAMKQHHLVLLKSLLSNPVPPAPPATNNTSSSPLPPSLVSPSTSSDTSSSSSSSDIITSNSSTTTVPTTKAWAIQRHQFQTIVHQIRRSTTSWLFSKVFQDEHDLVHYFMSFRRLFLLGDGELAIRWLEGLGESTPDDDDDTMKESDRRPNNNVNNTDLWHQRKREWDRLFIKASVGTDSEDHLDGYTFDFSTSLEHHQPNSFMSLLKATSSDDDRGHLVYKLQWPIDLFLGHGDMQRYSDLWTLLMGLKKVQTALTRVFITAAHMDQDTHQLWRLRSLMLFWVDTLWSHVQGNVIQQQYDRLITACHPLDFDKVQKAHDEYLMNLTRGCLLSSEGCRHALLELLHTCLTFCRLVHTAAPVSSLEKSDHMYGLLSGQRQEMKLNGHLNELLLRLDYNKWYSAYRYREISDLFS
ncbi:hypothetical protein [Absidia glauca]|uniref:Spindle pole body component n=1 Tax=Absidia glauca TaxID=4829 RepID=A0A168PV63_ABSGL|nr:hypothetical protein [Absidia glauca]